MPDAAGSLGRLSQALTAPAAELHPADEVQRELDRLLSGETPFASHFQPIVDLQRGVTVGYESLVRFQTTLRMSPDRWFAAAEATGRRLRLEALVTKRALEARSLLPPNCFLSVNVSPSFIRSDEWSGLLEEVPFLGGVLVELTENESVADYGGLHARIGEVRQRGGHIAVDDAGAGYSSLKHILELKPEFVKLDRIFAMDCDSDRAKSALIEMIGHAVGRLDSWLLVEGIETEAELGELIRLGVPLAQGYYLGRPKPEMEALDEEKAEEIRGRARDMHSGEKVARSVEPCLVCKNRDEAKLAFDKQEGLSLAAVVDQWERPVVFYERHPLVGLRVLERFMKVQVGHDARQALDRAMTRPPQERFDPLAATNERGELMGAVRVDRLTQQTIGSENAPAGAVAVETSSPRLVAS